MSRQNSYRSAVKGLPAMGAHRYQRINQQAIEHRLDRLRSCYARPCLAAGGKNSGELEISTCFRLPALSGKASTISKSISRIPIFLEIKLEMAACSVVARMALHLERCAQRDSPRHRLRGRRFMLRRAAVKLLCCERRLPCFVRDRDRHCWRVDECQ